MPSRLENVYGSYVFFDISCNLFLYEFYTSLIPNAPTKHAKQGLQVFNLFIFSSDPLDYNWIDTVRKRIFGKKQ